MKRYMFKDSPRDEEKEEIDFLEGKQQEEQFSLWEFLTTLEKKFRIFIEKKIYQENFGKVVDLAICFISFATSVINVVLSYVEPGGGPYSKIFNNLDFAACLFYLIVYILKWYVATHRIQYIFSLFSVLELFIMLPSLIFLDPLLENNPFYFMIPFSRYVRAIIFFIIVSRYFKLGQTDVDRQINIVLLTMVLLTYIASGMYAVVENKRRGIKTVNYLQFHDSVYFAIVSLATVGYGDEIPGSEFGRVIVLFIIFFTIVLIPAQTNELLRLMQIRSRFRRIDYKSLDMRHVVVCGYVDLDALETFVDELFHSDHGNLAINAVVMQDHDPSGEMEEYLQKNKLSMTYLAGDVFEDTDLDRASMTRAEACTVLTNKNSKNSLQEDFKNILTALAIKKFVYVQNQHLKDELKYNIKLCIQLIKPESKRLYFDSLNMSAAHDQLIIVEEIKMNLLAKSCFAPGLISCLSNLSASATTVGMNQDELEKEWLMEYADGMGHEIYRVSIAENEFFTPFPLTFKKLAEICFAEFQAVIFALEIEIKSKGTSVVKLNPSHFIFKDWNKYNFYLYLIGTDESLALKVQQMEMPDEKYEKHMNRPRTDRLTQEIKDLFMINKDGNSFRKHKRWSGSASPHKDETQASGNNMLTKIQNSNIMPESARENSGRKFGALLTPAREESTNELKIQIQRDIPVTTIEHINYQKTDEEIEFDKILEKNRIVHYIDDLNVASLEKQTKKKEKTEFDTSEKRQKQIEKDYDFLPKPLTQTDVLINERNIRLSDHIVVCGFHSSIYHFILPLRAKYLKSYQQDIVIIYPSFKKEIWETISRFPRVFLVEGSPLSLEVLRQGFIHKADKAVILGHDPSIDQMQHLDLNEEMVDAQTIFIYKQIKQINPNLQVLTEIFYQSNIDYLLDTGKQKRAYTFSTLFSAGEVYIATTIDTMTAQAFYNPHMVTILQQLLVGRAEKKHTLDDSEAEIIAHFGQDQIQQSNLWQILVPEEFVNQTYDRLFKHLLQKDLVAIGLYRLPGATDNKYPYVYTNPDPKTSITYKDRVFVLGKEIPNDLIIDVKKSKNRSNNNEHILKEKSMKKEKGGNGSSIHDFYGSKNHNSNNFMEQLNFNITPRSASMPKHNSSSREFGSFIQSKVRESIVQSLKGKVAGGSHSSPKHHNDSPSKRKAEKQQKKKKKSTNMNDYDDTQDQINSLEFMHRSILALESKLGDIEAKVQGIKKVIAKQNLQIKKQVIAIQQEIMQNLDDSSAGQPVHPDSMIELWKDQQH